MEYSDHKKERVWLDVSTEREIREIRETLRQMVAGLDALNKKVENMSNGSSIGASAES